MSFISAIVKWHEKLFQNGLFTQKATSLTVTFAIILGIIATYMNFHARQINWQLWEQNKEEFFFEGYTTIYNNGCRLFFRYSWLS